MSASAVQRAPTRSRNKAVGVLTAPMPGFIEPCDPTLYERAPAGNGWVYEIKTDGYRAQVHIRDKHVTISILAAATTGPMNSRRSPKQRPN
jgi:ATP-dependent DNA ligase